MHEHKLKLPNFLNLGAILPGQYGQAILPLLSSIPLFLTLQLSAPSVKNGFFLVKEGSNDCLQSVNLVIKPNKVVNVMIGSHSRELPETKTFNGQLYVKEENMVQKIKLGYRIEAPRIICKKTLEEASTKMKMLKIIINKAVTNDARIALFNPEAYPIGLEPSLLHKSSIKDIQNPFLLKVLPQSITAESKEQFILNINFQTNIGFKNAIRRFKKVTLRNVLLVKSNSILIWCLPIQITVVFVKQPEFKEQ